MQRPTKDPADFHVTSLSTGKTKSFVVYAAAVRYAGRTARKGDTLLLTQYDRPSALFSGEEKVYL